MADVRPNDGKGRLRLVPRHEQHRPRHKRKGKKETPAPSSELSPDAGSQLEGTDSRQSPARTASKDALQKRKNLRWRAQTKYLECLMDSRRSPARTAGKDALQKRENPHLKARNKYSEWR